MNRRAQLPILMLFLVAVALAVTALMIFITSDNKFDSSSAQNSNLVVRADFGRQYAIETCKFAVNKAVASGDARKFSDFAMSKNIGIQETGNFFEKISAGKFRFEKSGEIYKLEIAQIVIEAVGETSKVQNLINICLDFDSKGAFLDNCAINFADLS